MRDPEAQRGQRATGGNTPERRQGQDSDKALCSGGFPGHPLSQAHRCQPGYRNLNSKWSSPLLGPLVGKSEGVNSSICSGAVRDDVGQKGL